MAKSKKYVLSVEVYKYPYCGSLDDTQDYLSDKICCYTIRIRKKIVRKTKRVFVYGQLILSLSSGLAPTQAIGLPILPPPIMRSIHSDTSKEIIISQVINNNPEKIIFNEKQMDKLYDLAVKCRNNSINREELIMELRGGGIENWVAAFGMIIAIITLLNNADAFLVPLNPGQIVPPHLQWLYGNQHPGNHFGYGKAAGPRSLTITGLTQNAGSEKKETSSGSYNYVDVMKELEEQSSKNRIDIQVGGQIYMIKNPDSQSADELQFVLAEKVYDSIRESDTDISDIASNLGFKADNIKNVKDHVFYNEHDLDRYGPNEIEHKRFDATLEQALSWKRLEAGTHTQDDVTWIKHECAERHHELKYGSGYSEAHERAQSRYDGYPWENKF